MRRLVHRWDLAIGAGVLFIATLRAIRLVAGRHRLRLEYRPMAFVVGAWLTIAALVAYAGAIAVTWRRRGARAVASGDAQSG